MKAYTPTSKLPKYKKQWEKKEREKKGKGKGKVERERGGSPCGQLGAIVGGACPSCVLSSTAGYDSDGSHHHPCFPALYTFHQDLLQILWTVPIHDALHADCSKLSWTQALDMDWLLSFCACVSLDNPVQVSR